MKAKLARLVIGVAFAVLFMLDMVKPLDARGSQATPFDAVMKINQLEKLFTLIDDLAVASPAGSTGSPTAFLKGMIHGTEWIDSRRAIVVSISLQDNKPLVLAMVPYKNRNDDFQAAFNASRGVDYYVLAFPVSAKQMITPQVETALDDISRARTFGAISLELAGARLIQKYDEQIQAWIEQVKNNLPAPTSASSTMKPSDLANMMSEVLNIVNQVDLISLGVDLDAGNLITRADAKAQRNSKLSGLFTGVGKTSLMGGYLPEHAITFRSRSFPVKGFSELIDTGFGGFYKTMGIDFSELARITEHLTGEMAGGISLDKTGARFEMITVLKDASAAADFLDAVYLPWIIKYAKQMNEVMEKELNIKPNPEAVRTPDTTVSGNKVVGVKIWMPSSIAGPKTAKPDQLELTPYELRMTTLGRLLVTAPDDTHLKRLLDTAGRLKERPAAGPLMEMKIDLASYLKTLEELSPNLPGRGQPIPRMGEMVYRFDMDGGSATGSFSVPVDDITFMISRFQGGGKTANQQTTAASGIPKKKPESKSPVQPVKPKEEQKAKKPASGQEKTAAYWMDKGCLVSAYENDRAAVGYFRKALEIDPEKTEAYFQLGVSLGELGNYREALTHINRAIAMDPRKGLYYYGRARVYLLSGDEEKAVEDLKHAASLGSRDAQNSLRNHFKLIWE